MAGTSPAGASRGLRKAVVPGSGPAQMHPFAGTIGQRQSMPAGGSAPPARCDGCPHRTAPLPADHFHHPGNRRAAEIGQVHRNLRAASTRTPMPLTYRRPPEECRTARQSSGQWRYHRLSNQTLKAINGWRAPMTAGPAGSHRIGVKIGTALGIDTHFFLECFILLPADVFQPRRSGRVAASSYK